ncbi:MAG: tRNA CCA-pyrophosphorylase [Buchnera aphidicola (Schlechtendalia peitan)]
MKIYLVGGAIRDQLLNVPIKDRDWVIVGATEKMLLDLNFKKVGKDFPVFLHPISHEEYSLARIDRKSGFGYTGFKTNYSKTVTLKEDLSRRDLTINAIAQDNRGNYIDFFGGLKDLKNRILRHVSCSFCEDPLRIFRIARFSATLNHFGFQIASETMQLMISMVKSKELLYLTKDRIWRETEKACNTNNPHVYFQILYHCNALSIIFPEINYAYQYGSQNINKYFPEKHYRFNFFIEIAKISRLNTGIDIRFAYICAIICHAKIFNTHAFLFKTNNKIFGILIEKLCNRLRIPAYIKDLSIIFSKNVQFLSIIYLQSSKNIVLFLNQIDAWRKPNRVKKLSILIDLYMFSCMKLDILDLYHGNFLRSVFNVSNKVSIKPIISVGFIGIKIRHELIRLRIIAIDKWRKKFSILRTI